MPSYYDVRIIYAIGKKIKHYDLMSIAKTARPLIYTFRDDTLIWRMRNGWRKHYDPSDVRQTYVKGNTTKQKKNNSALIMFKGGRGDLTNRSEQEGGAENGAYGPVTVWASETGEVISCEQDMSEVSDLFLKTISNNYV